MTNLEHTDTKFYQQFLERNGEIGVAEIEMAIKQLEEKEEFEKCAYLAKQIEDYYARK